MSAEAFDLVVAGCRVIDGSGRRPAFTADVGIVGDRIARIGELHGSTARSQIDANGLCLAPGLIDVHVHSEATLLRHPVHEAGLYQGITTHIVGQDGFGFAPATAETISFMSDYLAAIYGPSPGFEPGGIASFLDCYDGASTVNVATLVPAGCVRMNVLGNVSRAASKSDLDEMTRQCRAGMEEGAVGLSSGLDYTPGCHASTEELALLCEAIAPFRGVYVTHMRYRLGLLRALDEAIEIGRRSGAGVHISHLFADHTEGVAPGALIRRLANAASAGLEVSYDTYPYVYGCTILAYLLPLWTLEGSFDDVLTRLSDPSLRSRIRTEVEESIPGWSDFLVAGELSGERSRLVGLDILTAADGADPVDFLCELLQQERLNVLLLGRAGDSNAEKDLGAMLVHDGHQLSSDGIYCSGLAHPRGYGAFARFVHIMQASGERLALERAVNHATARPARRFGLVDRGLVKEGYAADLFVFEPESYRDIATPNEPRCRAEGVRHVIVNGVTALHDGKPTGETPGRGLRANASTVSDGRDRRGRTSRVGRLHGRDREPQ